MPSGQHYSSEDVARLQRQAREIVEHELFGRFTEISPAAAAVLQAGSGSTYGASLEAAVEEFSTFLRVTASDS